MKLTTLKKKHPSGFWVVFSNLDLNKIFKKRDLNWFHGDRDFCVYLWVDEFNNCQYIGMGRYYNLMSYPVNKWKYSRPFNHKKDLLIKSIKSNWKCIILSYGMTSKEAHIYEAFLISSSNRFLSKKGQKYWDGETLINKKRERKYEGMFEEYLNLDGNNYWETSEWKTHNN